MITHQWTEDEEGLDEVRRAILDGIEKVRAASAEKADDQA